MVVKIEDLRIGMEIAFSSLEGMDNLGWLVDINEPYKVTEISEERFYIGLLGEHTGNYYVEYDELENVYIFDNKEESKGIEFTEAKVVGLDGLNLKQSALETLDLIARHYDSIPSDLVRELTRENLYEK